MRPSSAVVLTEHPLSTSAHVTREPSRTMAPSQQKVLYLTKKNGPFEVHTADVPKPGPGQLLIKVEAAGLNPVDWKIQLYGLFSDTMEFPSILGSDAAGTVEELGEGVTGFTKGDRV